MKALFNEISARIEPKDSQVGEFDSKIKSLIEDLKFLASISLDKPIFYAGNYKGIAPTLHSGKNSLLNFARRSGDAEIRALILAFVYGVIPIEDGEGETHKESTTSEQVAYVDAFQAQEGQLMASVSLKDITHWLNWELRFDPVLPGRTVLTIPHIGEKIGILQDYVEALLGVISPISNAAPKALNFKTPELPRSKWSNSLINRVQHLVDAAKTPQDKSACASLVGGAVAELNAYIYSQEVSRKNSSPSQMRRIFFNGELKKYLSIDFMHSAYEVCDLNGQHLCEINFKGERTAGPAANHSIVV